MFQTDTIHTENIAGVESEVAVKHTRLTPAKVLSWYGNTLTESQKDSVIQLHIKPQPIRWSQRPDTLHLPGHEKGKSILDVSLPQYYKDNFFADKPYYHPEIMGGRQGVAGDPIPYNIAADNTMTMLLFGCFLVMCVLISSLAKFFGRQTKIFAYGERGNLSDVSQTSSEFRTQFVASLIGCLMYALLYFQYLNHYVVETFTISEFRVVMLISLIIAAYFLAKWIMHQAVDWVFFDSEKRRQWRRSNLFLLTCQAVVVMPVVYVQLYFNLSLHNSIIIVALALILFKLLAMYKLANIFFKGKALFSGFFLYFCTLEIMPIALLWSVLNIVCGNLKINF